jgi:serine protease Do
MRVQTRDWLKFVSLVGIAFLLGLVFASALDLPRVSSASAAQGAALPATVAVRNEAPLPAPSAAAANDFASAFMNVADHVRPAVVFIRSERPERAMTRRLPRGFEEFFRSPQGRPPLEQGTGSGFIVSNDGFILTNNHVVAEANRVIVRLYDKREFTAKIVGSDPATDVAVIKIDATGLPMTSLGNSDSTRIGEWVLAIGNPMGESFTFTVTAGIISAKGRLLRGLEQVRGYSIQDFIQTDAAINPGNSGGPLVNLRGQVVGINSAIASETGTYVGYGFAIPINLVRAVMDQLVTTGHVTRAVMGININDASPEDAEAVGLKEIRGVVVHDFTTEDSPARRAGLQQGDVIVALDGQPVEYMAQLQQRIGFKKPGETVEVTVQRKGGERRTLRVRLMEADATQLAGRDRETTPSRERGGAQPMESELGVSVEPLSQEDAAERSLEAVRDAGGGLVVTDVAPQGPAAGKLFPPSQGATDIILKIDGQPVRSRADLRAALRKVKSGDIATLVVFTLPGDGSEGRQRVARIRIP